ncbi:hypothetical protein AVEN_1318-1 [Araneus ventricosus]|uniref:Uncharacterized protein n=1 Tax=Araneus ventricosus TaxID=182803 RepID=A0A4Y2D2R8_ARAVE|nr:hypothetical protein AVEN_1318-1 [Araneus ventricosus]
MLYRFTARFATNVMKLVTEQHWNILATDLTSNFNSIHKGFPNGRTKLFSTLWLRNLIFILQSVEICLPAFFARCREVGIDPTNLSCDQKYLLDISTAISSGVGSSDLAKRQPGTLNLARWIKTANRILRLYISTSNPPNELIALVVFILRVYVPSWFRIKFHHSIKDGARHLWHFISSSRYLFKKYHDIIESDISRNAYFVAPENMFLSMLTDERCHIRTLAALRIIKAREIFPDGNCVRRFVIPAVNFRATDYVDLIDWQACNVTPPKVLKHISSHELLKMIQDDVPMDGWDFIKFRLNTQAVERIVKLITEASRKRVGPQNRDGFIRATLESRKQMSQSESKKDCKK